MKKIIIAIGLLFWGIALCAHVTNRDKPLKGEWNFKLEKVWDINRAGENVLARPGGILASRNGVLVINDRKARINYLFDKNGRYIKSFGKRGEGPGEIRIQTFFFLVNDKILVPDVHKIHCFSLDGKLVENKTLKPALSPNLFLNEKEYITAPASIFDTMDGTGQIKRVNLVNGKENTLAEFRAFRGGSGKSNEGQIFDMIVMGLSPLMTIGYDGKDRLYYGMSDNYHINIMNLNGEKIGSFSLDRKARGITKSRKEEHFKNSRLPQGTLGQIVKSFPDKLTCFQGIKIHNGLAYIFGSDLGNSREKQEIDVFSMDGTYLYRGVLRFGKDYTMMFSPFGNLRVVKDSLYVVLESESGNVLVRKYKISLPPQ
ncbi:6-bladed beta-propeller [Acidobacteriota bacterium]